MGFYPEPFSCLVENLCLVDEVALERDERGVGGGPGRTRGVPEGIELIPG